MRFNSIGRTCRRALAAMAVAGLFSAGLQAAAKASADHLEPGLQGQAVPADNPGSVLARPYSKSIRVVGHEPIRGRDSNVQLSWVDHCAYVSSTGGPFPLIATSKGDTTLTGIAVIDVSDPAHPRTVKLLRDKASGAAFEAMHAVTAPDGRKVLAAGTYSDGKNGPNPGKAAWLDIYDVSNCADPKLTAEIELPENVHSLTISPDGRHVYGTLVSIAEGGLHVIDIADMAKPHYLGKFGATTADGRTVPFAPHEVSVSPDGRRIYAGVNDSKVGDLNRTVPFLPPTRASMGPDGGGLYIFDNSDIADGKPDPKLRLIGTAEHAGWHSAVRARIGGVPYIVAGSELGRCPGTWPRFVNIADERKPFIAGEFKLAMNREENCPKLSQAEIDRLGFIGTPPGTAALHFNDVDSATDTKLGLFNFAWAGLRIVDIRNPAKPVELAYFKPGDFCTGHVRYFADTGRIWALCGQSGFHVLQLSPEVRAALR